MNTTKQQLPAHMSTEQYHRFFDSCFDEEVGYYDNSALDSLQEMIELSLAIEKMSEEMDALAYTDASLEIENWHEGEFVCESGDLTFRQSKKEGFYLASVRNPYSTLGDIPIGLMNKSAIFMLLTSQRRLEQGR